MKLFFALTIPILAGPYPPAAEMNGSTAIPLIDERIFTWADRVVDYSVGEDVDVRWQDATAALGEPDGTVFDVVSLGRGGSITLGFPQPIENGPGPDFAVFENAFSDNFLELAFVEVSPDGDSWTRFPNDSLTAALTQFIDPTDIDGLAGKYRVGFGTPFDLEVLDLDQVQFVRLIDITGDGGVADSSGDPIFDPWPTMSSTGFDLSGVAVLRAPPITGFTARLENGNIHLQWDAEPGLAYQLEASENLDQGWEPVASISAVDALAEWTVALGESSRRFFRIARHP